MSDTLEPNHQIIRVGSRKSELALVQTRHVIACLQKFFPNKKFEIHTMTTMGDRILNISLPKIGEKSLFTKDLEDALYSKRIDFVVHSLKDLPTSLPDGLAIGAILQREDPRDALILNKKYEGKCLDTLPPGSIIGTSSLRRTSQLNRRYPHLHVQDIRGNLNTRLAKLDALNSKYSGIILAQAGIVRMGWHDRISQSLEPAEILYAVGQGALAVECRASDAEILSMLSKLSCIQTQCRVLAERSFLKTLGGGCSAPVAVQTVLTRHDEQPSRRSASQPNRHEFELNINGAVWSLDGKVEIVGANQCTLQLNESMKRLPDDDGQPDIIDTKRFRLSPSVGVDDDNDANGHGQHSPPKVVDHSAMSDAEAGDAAGKDLTELIHIHEDAFKKCPYANVLTRALSIRSSLDQAQSPPPPLPLPQPSATIDAGTPCDTDKHAHLKCPIHFPIGQDVMGQCPYFDTSDEHNLEILTECIEHNQNEATNGTTALIGDGETNTAGCPFRSSSVASPNKTCPFSSKKSNPDNDQLKNKLPKCPYLDASSSTNETIVETIENAAGQSKDGDIELFCGLFGHAGYSLDILRTCEAIGQKLAAQLISNGAHKVMEAAQNEIRKGA